jgi:hypothetical protein
MTATTELMNDPDFRREMAAIEADLARGETQFIPHEEVERRLRERFDRARARDVVTVLAVRPAHGG